MHAPGTDITNLPKLSEWGFVVGMTSEAVWLKNVGIKATVGGGTYEGALKASETLIQNGCRILVSFGLAGGLDPKLKAGSLVIAKEVLIPISKTENSAYLSFFTAPELRRLLGGETHQKFLGSFVAATTKQEKSALFQNSHAVALDLETGAVAQTAAKYDLPFALLRAIIDEAKTNLPLCTQKALRSDGSIALGSLLYGLLQHPYEIIGLIRLAEASWKAKRTLLQHLKQILIKAQE